MIQHIYERCVASGCGDVFVACDNEEVANIITKIGGRFVMTDPNLQSGTDRAHAALSAIDPNQTKYDIIINVQGDIPNIESNVISQTATLLDKLNCDITTPVVLISDEAKKTKPSAVKPVIAFKGPDYGRALYFTRATAPYGLGDLYEHVGLYVYKRSAIEKFVKLPQSSLEKRESLEQLRALEDGMTIYVQVVDSAPVSVDIPEDLEAARHAISKI